MDIFQTGSHAVIHLFVPADECFSERECRTYPQVWAGCLLNGFLNIKKSKTRQEQEKQVDCRGPPTIRKSHSSYFQRVYIDLPTQFMRRLYHAEMFQPARKEILQDATPVGFDQ